ncbi:hypothetical protein [Bartonella grahamii]|nr:hypothetical protein [Bartonella grahamii]
MYGLMEFLEGIVGAAGVVGVMLVPGDIVLGDVRNGIMVALRLC